MTAFYDNCMTNIVRQIINFLIQTKQNLSQRLRCANSEQKKLEKNMKIVKVNLHRYIALEKLNEYIKIKNFKLKMLN